MPASALMNCAACPHQTDCREIGSCLDEINAAQLAARRSCPYPTLMTSSQVAECMEALRNGLTLRRITGGGKFGKMIVSLTKFKAHCAAYPAWGAEAMKLARANAKAADFGKGHKRNLTHCKQGHPLSGDNLYIAPGRRERKCMTCTKLRYSTPRPPTAGQIERATELLNGGSSLNLVCTGKIAGKLVQEPLFSYRKLRFYRAQHPAFDLLVKSATAGSNSRAQLRRWAIDPTGGRRIITPRKLLTREPALTGVIAGPSHEVFTVVDRAVPRNLDFETRKEVMSEMMLSILEGKLTLDDAPLRWREFLRITNRMFPTQYAKFGNSLLLSLDEAMFDDGGGRRGDSVTHNLWT
ncbi:hypothetical protein TM239_63470 [Bradyrhizobium sp. TM239]|nr:hypothetical protein TM239_63470 [Bradyrhizobium sp. TM239]